MKKILLSLGLLFVGFISFCSAYDISFTYNCRDHYSACVYDHNYNYTIYFTNDNKFNYGTNYYLSCDADNMTSFTWNINQQTNSSWNSNGTDNPIYLNHELVCLPSDCSPYISFNFSFSSDLVSSDSFTCHITDTQPGGGDSCDYSDYVSIGEYNSLSGQYNNLLVEYSALMTNYSRCNSQLSGVQSDLSSCQSFTSGFNEQLNYCNSELVSCNSSLTSCLQYNCPETELSYSKFYVRHGESTWSQLTGTENYYVYLPEYLGYNYEYSNGTDLDFTVGVATDTGYINNINAIQNSKPSQEDLNKLISEVIPLFVPGLAVILLLYFIFRFIKKVF